MDKKYLYKSKKNHIRTSLQFLIKKIDGMNAADTRFDMDTHIHDLLDKHTHNTSLVIESFLTEIPHHLFFVWLGMIDERRLKYPHIWKGVGVSPVIYYDSKCYLAGFYKTELLNLANLEQKSLIEIQDEFYNFFISNCSPSFDNAFLDFLSAKNYNVATIKKYKNILLCYKKKKLVKDFHFIDVNSFENLFYRDDILRVYVYEVILRNNFAAACDILRLLLLYKFGGMYVDFDTLPDLDFIFSITNKLLKKNHGPNKNVIDIIKTEEFLKKTDPNHSKNYSHSEKECYNSYVSYVKSEYPEILSSIHQDLSLWDGKLRKFQYPQAFTHTGKISASKNNLAEYNNNILISHSGSKGIKILFIEMMRRYRYIEKNNFLFSQDIGFLRGIEGEGYYDRLKLYRFDGTKDSENVTLILSGPSFILEVILGLAYRILSIDENTSPLSISYALREKNIGIGFENQTMFTLDHAQSSWM